MSETTDTILSGLRGQLERIATDARAAQKTAELKAVEALKAAATEQMQRIDRRIDALAQRHALEPALWGAAAGAALVALALILGVWMGSKGVTVHWLLTFGWHL